MTGSPGGSRIITTVLQMVVDRMIMSINVTEATNAPRSTINGPDELRVEKGFSPGYAQAAGSKRSESGAERGDGRYTKHYGWAGRWTVSGASDPRSVESCTAGY
ncbi:gamma-glutamyltransferase [Escherichia coli]